MTFTDAARTDSVLTLSHTTVPTDSVEKLTVLVTKLLKTSCGSHLYLILRSVNKFSFGTLITLIWSLRRLKNI